MSLQSDFERCLEYAEELESYQQQKLQAQNNIMFVGNEIERLNKKFNICMIVCVIAVFFTILLFSKFSYDVIPSLVLCTVAFIVSISLGMKAKKQSAELESQKSILIQQCTIDAENCDREIIALINEIKQENLFDIVPADYFYTGAIEFCLAQMRKKLANTATEAFQQLEAEIKRLEQMEHFEQMHIAEMEQLGNIKRAVDINTFVTLMEQENKRT